LNKTDDEQNERICTITKRPFTADELVKWCRFGSFPMKDVPHGSSISPVWKNTPLPKVKSESHSFLLDSNSFPYDLIDLKLQVGQVTVSNSRE